MIAYHIQCHQNLEQVTKLTKWLGPSTNVCLVTQNPLSISSYDLGEQLKHSPNTYVEKSIPITWGGRTFLTSILEGIKKLLTLSESWKFYVNLSESCAPIKPSSEILDFLIREESLGFTEHVTSYGGFCAPQFPSVNVSTKYTILKLFRSDTEFHVNNNLISIFEAADSSPIMNVALRLGIYAEDFSGSVYLRPLYDAEQHARSLFFNKFPPVIGRPWFVLSRKMCEWICNSKEASDCYAYLGNTFIPDECYFQTILHSEKSPSKKVNVRDNIHLDHGAPLLLTDRDLERVTISKSLFIRKLDYANSPKLTEYIDYQAFRG